MAYSPIEQKYLDTLAMAAFPEAVDEPMAEPSLEGMQLAAGPSTTRTDAGPRFGRGGVTKAQSQAAGGLEKPLGAMLDMGAATVKGAAQGFVGTPGDLEGIARTVINMMGGNVDENTVLPTTDEVKAWLDKFPMTRVGDGKNPYESIGEVVAPGGYIDAGKAAIKGGKALAPTAANMMESGLRKSGMIMDIVPTGPRVDSIDRFPVGPGSIKPTVIAPDAPLYREMSADNLTDFLRQDNQFSYAAVFVTDNADLALGQGSNKGIKVQFRANAVSGEEHRKPMTGDLAGREYKANVFAPKAIESITFDSEADLKKMKGLSAKVLQTEFERVSDGKKNIVFIRKAQDKEKK